MDRGAHDCSGRRPRSQRADRRHVSDAGARRGCGPCRDAAECLSGAVLRPSGCSRARKTGELRRTGCRCRGLAGGLCAGGSRSSRVEVCRRARAASQGARFGSRRAWLVTSRTEKTMKRAFVATTVLAVSGGLCCAQSASPGGVKTLAPEGAIKSTGTWDVGSRAGDFVFVAGMRGIDPKTNTLVQGEEARIRQAFLNMKLIAESEGASLRDCVRI